MRRIVLFIVMFLAFHVGKTSHIVGGELVFKAITGGMGTHRIGLNLYFDEINGIPQAEDQSVFLYIFQKSDNRRVGSVQAPKIGRKNITYANPQCGNAGLKTLFISYAIDVVLKPEDFNDPEGYYIVWDRCCRNNVIDNIRTPGDVGSLFSIYFPPLIKEGKIFMDSAPEFEEVQGDYACLNADFYIDFKAKDADGDSLVYSLSMPVTGFSNRAVPNPQALGSSNYPVVSWVEGISINNVIPGPRPLRIDSQTGRLSFTAGKLGLYVFSIGVTEYRNREKIGSISRDFQFKVIDCFEALPPKVLALEDSGNKLIKNNEIIRLSQTDPACFTVKVTDPNFNQLLKVKGRAVNSTNSSFYFLPNEFRTRKTNDTLSFQFCLEDCFETEPNRPVRLQLIVEDESCPVPLTDTLTFLITREGSPNTRPAVSTTLPDQYVDVIPDKILEFNVLGKDVDPDTIRLSAQGRGFSLSTYGLKFDPVSGRGNISQKFSWKAPCNLKVGDTLLVDFKVTDLRCGTNGLTSTTTVYFVIQNAENAPPSVRTTLPGDTLTVVLNATEPISIAFDVIARDLDTTQLSLFGVGRGFGLGEAQIDFLNKIGIREVTSPFNWTPDCSLLNGQSERLFTIDFICEDRSCLAARDTITVNIMIKDVLSDAVVNLPNVITPNQDGKNDCFTLSSLPPDNCIQSFEEITIYNRWGTRVFQGQDRNQDWCPDDIPAGSYFFQIKYTKNIYKGSLLIIK